MYCTGWHSTSTTVICISNRIYSIGLVWRKQVERDNDFAQMAIVRKACVSTIKLHVVFYRIKIQLNFNFKSGFVLTKFSYAPK